MKTFNINDIVKYPEHLGFHSEIIGEIIGISTNINYDFHNNPYVWITILEIKSYRGIRRKSTVASHKLTLIKGALI